MAASSGKRGKTPGASWAKGHIFSPQNSQNTQNSFSACFPGILAALADDTKLHKITQN
jgi:hypothetical protein